MTDELRRFAHEEQSELVPLLLALTVVTGMVDAVSILRLGHVFVANMTGNIAFFGFALAGATGFSIAASLIALGAFLVGAAVWGRMPPSRPRMALARTAAFEAVLFGAAAGIAVIAGSGARYVTTIVLATAMGTQNVTVRKLAVRDMTTTVLTLTLTGLAADKPDLTQPDSHTARRLAAVASLVVGAIVGAIIVLQASTAWGLGAAAALLAAVAVAARRDPEPGGHPESGK